MVFTDEEKAYALETHGLSENNLKVAADLFKEKFGFMMSRETIRRLWKEMPDYKPNSHGGRRTGLTLDNEEVKRTHEKYEGDFPKMAEELGFPDALERRCKKLALDLENTPKKTWKKKGKTDPYKYYSHFEGAYGVSRQSGRRQRKS